MASPPRPTSRHARISPLVRVALPLAIVVGWIAGSAGFHIPEFFLPSPGLFAAAFVTLVRSPDFWLDAAVSSARIGTGFLASAVVAIPLGVAMGRSRRAHQYVDPIISFVRYLPVPALVPLSILWFG